MELTYKEYLALQLLWGDSRWELWVLEGWNENSLSKAHNEALHKHLRSMQMSLGWEGSCKWSNNIRSSVTCFSSFNLVMLCKFLYSIYYSKSAQWDWSVEVCGMQASCVEPLQCYSDSWFKETTLYAQNLFDNGFWDSSNHLSSFKDWIQYLRIGCLGRCTKYV